MHSSFHTHIQQQQQQQQQQVGVDYYALSFVRDADVIYDLKDWLAQQGVCVCGCVGGCCVDRICCWLCLLTMYTIYFLLC